MCLLHRLAEGVLPSQLDQINADPKGNWIDWCEGKLISNLYMAQSAKV